jgi:alpha-tubulin suppressor-like RCC1 family protein
MSDGTIEAWGQNTYGQLGDGTTKSRNSPVRVAGITNAVAISAANLYSLALLANGTVVAWGYNAFGQLGDGTTTNRLTPTPVAGLDQAVVQISAGGNVKTNGHALALMRDGTVRAWGCNHSGELGNGTTTNSSLPVVVNGLSGITQVAAGGPYSAAVTKDGSITAWGSNSVGELGNGIRGGKGSTKTPKLVPGLAGASILSAGPPGQVLVYG